MMQYDSLEDQLAKDLEEQQQGGVSAPVYHPPAGAATLPVDPNNPTGPLNPAGTEPPKPPDKYPGGVPYDMLKGWEPSKLGAADGTEKYKIGGVLQSALQRGLAPTPETLKSLLGEFNGLGIGEFSVDGSGRGDKLMVKNGTGQLAGYGGPLDLVQGGDKGFWWGYDDGTSPAGGQTPAVSRSPASVAPSSTTGRSTAGVAAPGSVVNPAAYGVDPGSLNGGEAVPGQPGMVFRHNGQGWVIESATGTSNSTSTTTNTNPTDLQGLIAQMLQQQQDDRKRNEGLDADVLTGLRKQISDASAPVTQDDPEIRMTMDAYRGQQDRALRSGRNALAERAQANGQSAGSFDASLQSSYQAAGSDAGAAEAKLLTDKLNANKDRLTQALTQGQGRLTADEQQQLTAQLGVINARLQELATKQAGDISNRELDIRQNQGDQGLALDRDNLNFRKGAFYDQLGFDIGSREAGLNEQLISILRGA